MISLQFTYEQCITAAIKHDSLNDFEEANPNIFKWVKIKGWKSKCADAIRIEKTKREALKAAARYKYIGDFRKYELKLYDKARNLGIMNQCTAHMLDRKTCMSFEECAQKAHQHKDVLDWLKSDPESVWVSIRNFWYKDCLEFTSESIDLSSRTYTFGEITSIAECFKSKAQWEQHHPRSFDLASDNFWLDSCETKFAVDKKEDPVENLTHPKSFGLEKLIPKRKHVRNAL